MSTRKRKRVDDEGAGQKQTFKDLTAEDKSTLMKLAKEGKSTAEIAASLNLSPGSVRGWKHRQVKSGALPPPSKRRKGRACAKYIADEASEGEEEDEEEGDDLVAYEPATIKTQVVEKAPAVPTSFVPACFRSGLRWYVIFPTTTPPFKMAFFVDWEKYSVIVHVTSPAVPPQALLQLTSQVIAVDEKQRTTTVVIHIPQAVIPELDTRAKPLKIGARVENTAPPDIPSDVMVGVALILHAEDQTNNGLVAV